MILYLFSNGENVYHGTVNDRSDSDGVVVEAQECHVHISFGRGTFIFDKTLKAILQVLICKALYD